MKNIPVFHPSGVALRSKSVPDGFVTKDFAKEWKNSVYFRMSKILSCNRQIVHFNVDDVGFVAAEHRR
jgi:hypothetical protein